MSTTSRPFDNSTISFEIKGLGEPTSFFLWELNEIEDGFSFNVDTKEEAMAAAYYYRENVVTVDFIPSHMFGMDFFLIKVLVPFKRLSKQDW